MLVNHRARHAPTLTQPASQPVARANCAAHPAYRTEAATTDVKLLQPRSALLQAQPCANRVVGVDLSPAMLSVARAEVERANLRNVQLRQGDVYALPVERDTAGTLDPYMNTSNSVSLFSAFRAGTAMSLMAVIGSTAGNRMLLTVPLAKVVGMDPGNREGLGQHGISFQADGADAAFYISQF